MFDINSSEFLLLLLVAVVVIGPERLPRYAEQLGGWVRTLRGFLRTAKQRVDEELGEHAADVDWTALDPRRYDPRRIVREALLDDPPAAPRVDPNVHTSASRPAPGRRGHQATGVGAGTAAAGSVSAGTGVTAPAGAAVPYDDEAT